MNSLGAMYQQGQGVAADAREAAKWYRAAAAQGNAAAMYNLGLLYEEGRGVAVNANEAIAWYRKAADLGNLEANRALERLKNKK